MRTDRTSRLWSSVAAIGCSALAGCTAADNVERATETAYDVVISVDYIPRDEGPTLPKDTAAEDTLADVVGPADTTGGETTLTDVVASDIAPSDATTGDVRDTSAADTKVPDTFVKEDATLVEDVTPTLGYRWVRITDDPNNASLGLCLLGNKATPGADIDALEALRDGNHVAYASKVIADLNKDPLNHGQPCDNVAGDENEALGAPDAGVGVGSVSLNGGSIILALDNDTAIEVGDVLHVFEVSTEVIGVPESYLVAISQNSTGPWVELGTFTGPMDIDVQLPPP